MMASLVGRIFLLSLVVASSFFAIITRAEAVEKPTSALADASFIQADIVALDQIIVYNRFGSFDPYGMIFALRRDVSQSKGLGDGTTAADCATMTGVEPGIGPLLPGKVRLKDCKRPRPLVLRGRVGDVLQVRLTNLLRPAQPGISETFCRTAVREENEPDRKLALPKIGDIRAAVSSYKDRTDGSPLCDAPGHVAIEGRGISQAGVDEPGTAADWPRTRSVSFVIPGLEPIVGPGAADVHAACRGLKTILPGEEVTCTFRLDREGTHLFQSLGAAVGGEGDGGSLTHGLFGSLIVEPAGSRFYRSQVPMAAFDAVWPHKKEGPEHARLSTPLFDTSIEPPERGRADGGDCAARTKIPVANMLRDCGVTKVVTLGGEQKTYPVLEIVHADINAIIVPPATPDPQGTEYLEYDKPVAEPFREFVVIFHDELKTYYTKEFENLANFEQFSGIRDGFGINYGASGAGSLVLANRKKIGPAADCPECMYEEFFLESWANGDPALLENFVDDPSNVHHSYLNDRVVFRNFHAGPKETHVFHLHSHQWYAGNDKNRGAYLDSQTIGPQQGMSYDIYGGGTAVYRPGTLKNGKISKGWYDTLGSGNRNRTPGDAIFHCHLYPHFAQGMWELWRVHDVMEDGTRTLPDGQNTPGLSINIRHDAIERARFRPGTATAGTGPSLWRSMVQNGAPGTELTLDQGDEYQSEGTPIPGLLPMPRQAAPLLPTYDADRGFPGYPFYVAGQPGHRTPQAPMDIAVEDGKRLDGGLGRHVITGGVRLSDVAAGPKSGWTKAGIEDRNGIPYFDGKIVPVTVAQKLALGDLTESYDRLSIRLLPPDGTRLERRAMAFHHEGLIEGDKTTPLLLRRSDGTEIVNLPGLVVKPFAVIPPPPVATAPASEQEAYEAVVASNRQALGYESVLVPDEDAADAPPPIEPAPFAVNGAPPKPGAPFADPCGAPDSLRGSALNSPRGDGDDDEFVPQTGRPPFARTKLVGGEDKFGSGILDLNYPRKDMTYDPGLSGFRRFKASVVQFDMIVNKAGWHDPQARINVLTRLSDLYKPNQQRAVSGREEPFYFRAFSGDCIEFRHTNETPHKLDLDDFQAKVPTDTIGQHIHLVKFDVTSSDGSGNGWNYEDGTFAPDELKERIHAANRQEQDAADTGWMTHDDNQSFAQHQASNHINLDAYKASVADGSEWSDTCGRKEPTWKLLRSESDKCFQTTVQRWFADPMLSQTGEEAKGRYSDRTLRTVFTHDHFAPSNIQQHGFYNALLIEPVSKEARVYATDRSEGQPMLRAAFVPWDKDKKEPVLVDAFKADGPLVSIKGSDPTVNLSAAIIDEHSFCDVSKSPIGDELKNLLSLCNFSDNGVGARALVEARRTGDSGLKTIADPLHPNYREFALAIADFALLYDGSQAKGAVPKTVDDLDGGGEADGIDRLIGEALFDYRRAVATLYAGKTGDQKAANICEHNRGRLASRAGAGRSIDGQEVLPPAQVVACDAIESYRTAPGWLQAAATQLKTAYFDPIRTAHGKPVYPPKRPEAISQTHHDPYLVNYRGEPIPLRVGETSSDKDLLANRACPDIVKESRNLLAVASADSVTRQKARESGDMARAFRTADHGDPCTPILETYDGERVMVRLIQGAQEVQHVFTIEGRTFRRNVDQSFGFGARIDGTAKDKGPTRWNDCMRAAGRGRPEQFFKWFGSAYDGSAEWLETYRKIAAECDNVAGFVSAQEIGISEHFEFAGAFSSSSGAQAERAKVAASVDVILKNGALPLRDSLYHFGTVDALWNGGWGLVRTYGHSDLPDTTACLDNASQLLPADGEVATAKDTRLSLIAKCLLFTTKKSGLGLRVPRLEPDTGKLKEEGAANAWERLKLVEDRATPALKDRSSDLPSFPDLSCPFIDPSEKKNDDDAGPLVNARHVFAAVAAFEARDLDTRSELGGIVYDARNGLYDPDGLVFVPLDPDLLGLEAEPEAEEGDDAAAVILKKERLGALASHNDGRFGTVVWSAVRQAARSRVEAEGLRPYVQRFNAGDCIHLVVVNGLTETGLSKSGNVFGDMVGNNRAGLRDRPGDAFLPRITRLNNDQIKDGASDAQDADTGELTASASLAVSLPLSQMTNVNDAPEPVGANAREALGPATRERDAPYTILTFYTGTVSVKAEELDKALRNITNEAVTNLVEKPENPFDIALDMPLCSFEAEVSQQQKRFGYAVWPAADYPCATGSGDQIDLNVLGRRYCSAIVGQVDDTEYSRQLAMDAGVKPDHAQLQGCLRQAVSHMSRKKVDEKVALRLRVVPHAFGTLPFKSISDPIGHGPHGLAGTVIIEPRSATYLRQAGKSETAMEETRPVKDTELTQATTMRTGRLGADSVQALNPSWTLVDRGATANDPHAIISVPDIEVPAVSDVSGYPADRLGEADIYETSLLWQDGLNLWDAKRRPFYKDGCSLGDPGCSNAGDASMKKRIGGPVPDCLICDDSYDRGEKGVSYGSNALFARQRGRNNIPTTIGPQDWTSVSGARVYDGGPSNTADAEGSPKLSDLNAWELPSSLFDRNWQPVSTPLVAAPLGAQIMVRIVEPQGRARQRAFVPLGAGYQDILPGFGSGHSTLLAPGKGVTAAMEAPDEPGDYVWFDGPRQLLDGGTWGHMCVEGKGHICRPPGH